MTLLLQVPATKMNLTPLSTTKYLLSQKKVIYSFHGSLYNDKLCQVKLSAICHTYNNTPFECNVTCTGKPETLRFTFLGMFVNLSLIYIIQDIWNESPHLSRCISAYSGTHSPSGVISCHEQFSKMRQL